MVKYNLNQDEVANLLSFFFNRGLVILVDGVLEKLSGFEFTDSVKKLSIRDGTEYLNVFKKSDDCYNVNYCIIELEDE